MASPRLLAVLTTFMMVASMGGANAAFTRAQLQDVERLILSKDCGSLLSYLVENPALLEGDDPLAAELRNFSQGVQSGLIQCLSVAPGQLDGAGQAVVAAY